MATLAKKEKNRKPALFFVQLSHTHGIIEQCIQKGEYRWRNERKHEKTQGKGENKITAHTKLHLILSRSDDVMWLAKTPYSVKCG